MAAGTHRIVVSSTQLDTGFTAQLGWCQCRGTGFDGTIGLWRTTTWRRTGTLNTAHFPPGSDVPFFSYPPVHETVEATLTEVARCTREDIRINTFMLDANSYLRSFVEKLTRMNRGRAFFTTPETLGSYVLVDFIEQKRALRGRTSRAG